MEWLKALIDYGIIGVMVLLSIIAVSIALERGMFFRRVKIENFRDRQELEFALTRRLHLIATIGSNAPYIGLLGTVLGIMLTFSTMGNDGMIDSGKIMSGLALALKATAVGLFVAIPAVTLYNLLLRSAKELLMKWDINNGRKGI
ncbi:MAG: TonB-system energizer ExbB [Dissulfurispiraceae bacterium]|nr:TonB-system energizer ExbB [Dissulfurispiraceae bacterium]